MKLSNQEIFDIALNGIRNQNYEPSVNKEGTCAYRGENNTKCAIGHCITEHYAYSWDQLSSSSIRNVLYLKKKEYSIFFEDSQLDFLAALQDVHDLIIGKDQFEKEMRNLASEYSLNYTEI